MSGAEAFAVLGVISSVIAVIETSNRLWDAAKSNHGLPEAFRKVSENIPLVLDTLKEAEQTQRRAIQEQQRTDDADNKQSIEEASKAVKPLISTCKENAEYLREIFEKVIRDDNTTWQERYKKAVQSVVPGRRGRVEQLMKEILEKLRLLHDNQSFKAMGKFGELAAAVDHLSNVDPSLPDEAETHYTHTGRGPQNIQMGSGTFHVNTQSGDHATMNIGTK